MEAGIGYLEAGHARGKVVVALQGQVGKAEVS